MRNINGHTRWSTDWSASSTRWCWLTSSSSRPFPCCADEQRSASPPDLQAAVTLIRGWFNGGEVRFLARESERLAVDLLSVIAESEGALNSNDALLVVREREGAIDNLASSDSGFDAVEGFWRISYRRVELAAPIAHD